MLTEITELTNTNTNTTTTTKPTGLNVLITSALPYVNNIPHIGTITGCVLPADILSRYYKIMGNNVIYICGADEYGTSTEVKALEEQLEPYALCSKYLERHKEIYNWFNIDFTYFGRTSTPDPHNDTWNHTKLTQEIFMDLYNNGYIDCEECENLWCDELNAYVADRFVIGTCPSCVSIGERGDQCSNCSLTFDSAACLLDPKYKFNKSYNLHLKKTRQLFLNLPKLKDQIIDHLITNIKAGTSINNDNTNDDNTNNDNTNTNTNINPLVDLIINGTISWINGLKKRCISRDYKWGTPIPTEICDKLNLGPKTFYNWFDAPIGYISITSNYTDNWPDWWCNPQNTKLIQVMGIDNIPFHTVMFPGTLLGTGKNYTLWNQIVSSYFLKYNDLKFSKTMNIGLFCDTAIKISQDLDISSDHWRYYLIKNRPETKDSSFTWQSFVNDCNANLANNFGNLVNRCFGMIKNYRKCYVNFKDEYLVKSNDLQEEVKQLFIKYHTCMKDGSLKGALIAALTLSTTINKFVANNTPWLLYKANVEDMEIDYILYIVVAHVDIICNMLLPIMPDTINNISKCIITDNNTNDITINLENYKIPFKILSLDVIKNYFNDIGIN